MPAKNEAPTCSEFARALAVRPLGTALRLDRVILISARLPWPKPAVSHPRIKRALTSATASKVPSRLFASQPSSSGEATVEVFERAGLSSTHHCWTVDSDESIERLIEAISIAPLATLGEIHVDRTELAANEQVIRPTFLVCTQGSHDQCCGTFGEALAETIIKTRPDYDLRRISHTGGHRFATTLLALPSGRMWAFADLALVDRIAAGSETGDDLVERCRGWWGVDAGPAQVAECVARASNGKNFCSPPQVLTALSQAGSTECAVISEDSKIAVTVRVVREVPTIACEAPGGLPVKPAREFAGHISAFDLSPS